MITQQELKELLNYDQDTGIFTWTGNNLTKNNRHIANKKAGWIGNRGYARIELNNKAYQAHRLAWLYMTGSWPKNQIDHINGIRNDNRFCNLREATNKENAHNKRIAPLSNKSTGILGVTYNKKAKKFIARIGINKNSLYLGSFDSLEEAHKIYINKKREIHEFCTI